MFSDSSIKLFIILIYVIGLSLALLWLSQGGAFPAAIASLTLAASLIVFMIQHGEKE